MSFHFLSNASRRRHPRNELGAMLLVTMVILMLITMVTISTIRATTLDERMAGNARDRDRAFQAAEAAVRLCLNQLQATPPTYPIGTLTPVASGAPPHWEVDSNWTSDTISTAVTLTAADEAQNELSAQPRCMVETLGSTGSFRVTGRAVGGSPDSIVILQATLSDE
jgi:type IV pilus assembly protein PilX